MRSGSEGTAEEPPSDPKLLNLKEFRTAGRGFWSNVSEENWNDWRWQLKNRITTVEQLEKYLPSLTPEERAGTILANSKLAMAITPYFFNLIDPTDELCPIRRQVIPLVLPILFTAYLIYGFIRPRLSRKMVHDIEEEDEEEEALSK